MDRKEQIFNAATNHVKTDLIDEELNAGSFIVGAEWAGANPCTPWISVKDKLPEEKIVVLGYFGEDVWSDGSTTPCYYLCMRSKDRPFANDENDFELRGVLTRNGDTDVTGPKYWMPIPNLPRKQNK